MTSEVQGGSCSTWHWLKSLGRFGWWLDCSSWCPDRWKEGRTQLGRPTGVPVHVLWRMVVSGQSGFNVAAQVPGDQGRSCAPLEAKPEPAGQHITQWSRQPKGGGLSKHLWSSLIHCNNHRAARWAAVTCRLLHTGKFKTLVRKNSSVYLTFKEEEGRGISRAADTLPRPCHPEFKPKTSKGLTNIHES